MWIVIARRFVAYRRGRGEVRRRTTFRVSVKMAASLPTAIGEGGGEGGLRREGGSVDPGCGERGM
jgi:hypothetical protein